MPSNTVAPITKNQVFSRVPKNDAVVYSTFDRSFRHLSAFDASYLIPFLVDEVYPGDIYKMSAQHLSRLMATVHPFMDNLVLKCYYFYCPNRIIWDHWKAFEGENKNPTKTPPSYQVPMLNSGSSGVSVGSIFDYAGIPTGVPNLEFSALPFRAMNLCYNEWFRDENLCDWLPVGGTTEDNEFGDSDQLSNYNLFKISKTHDYFTSSLPFQQKGEAMSISIGKTAPVEIASGVNMFKRLTDGNLYPQPPEMYWYDTIPNIPGQQGSYSVLLNRNFQGDPKGSGIPVGPNLVADLSNVTGFTISDLRTAIQLQALKELNARSGTRYKEIINGEWNVTISDATLDRPEFLGSYTVPFNIVTVASTAETSDNPQGNLAGYGVTPNGRQHCFSKAFEEHGWIIGFCVVKTEQSYQQGLNRMWSRKNRYDFYTPLLSNISEQAVKMKEILAQGSSVLGASGTPVDDETFGYQEAWAELRYKPNMVTGRMRSTADQSLDVWHLAPEFAPSTDDGVNLGIPLNEDFIEDNTNITLKRVLAIPNSDVVPQIISDNYFDLKCTRELPLYSVPAYLFGGRF